MIVKHLSECFVKPKHEVKDASNPLHLAPGELAMLSVHYNQKGLLFSKPSPTKTQPNPMKILIEKLKHSLSLTLVHFYPLAGQFESEIDESQHTSFIFINCKKGPGASFIHASLDMKVSDILSSKDVPFVIRSFFDHDRAVNYDGHTKPLLSIQVTELVDGVFLGCSMNHVCGDGTSFWNFLLTLSEIFMSNGEDIVISRPPIHKRWIIDGTGPIFKLPYTNPDEFIERYEAPKMRRRIFHFSSDSIAKLKAKANQDCEGKNITISSLQALSALVWRCVTRARCFPDDLQTKCRLAISNRARLSPPISTNCFGNPILSVQEETKIGELLSHNLGWAASLIHQAVVQHTDEKIRNMTKGWIESPSFTHLGALCDSRSVHIGSSPRFDMYGVEFGMGKALAVLAGHGNKFDGKIVCFPGREGGGSIDLEICLDPDAMCALELDEEFMMVSFPTSNIDQV